MNNHDYTKNKLIFNKIIGEKYKIKKDPNEKNILFIESKDKKIKCKYIMFLIENPINNTNKQKAKSIIMWSDSNPYMDIYTQELSQIIRKKLLLSDNNNLIDQNNQIIFKEDLDNLIKILIKNQFVFSDKNNNDNYCQWIITNNNNNIIEYFMITEIIYL
jgi:hypothetical protein